MHYKNGREVRVGDRVLVPNGNHTFVGVVVQTVPNATSCNLYAVPLRDTQLASAKDCLNLEDVMAAKIPDATVPVLAAQQPPVDNEHVAPGCEKFTAPVAPA